MVRHYQFCKRKRYLESPRLQAPSSLWAATCLCHVQPYIACGAQKQDDVGSSFQNLGGTTGLQPKQLSVLIHPFPSVFWWEPQPPAGLLLLRSLGSNSFEVQGSCANRETPSGI